VDSYGEHEPITKVCGRAPSRGQGKAPC